MCLGDAVTVELNRFRGRTRRPAPNGVAPPATGRGAPLGDLTSATGVSRCATPTMIRAPRTLGPPGATVSMARPADGLRPPPAPVSPALHLSGGFSTTTRQNCPACEQTPPPSPPSSTAPIFTPAFITPTILARMTKPNFSAAWARLTAPTGRPFLTEGGKEFSYAVEGDALRLSHGDAVLSRASLAKAAKRDEKRPKPKARKRRSRQDQVSIPNPVRFPPYRSSDESVADRPVNGLAFPVLNQSTRAAPDLCRLSRAWRPSNSCP